jgi:hypothetical protein
MDKEEKYFITPLAIQEAGMLAVCRSRAWSAKLITSSYWVRASQVSKTAPSGEYLSTGSFMIYGKKNYLPPMPLEMGFGILFRVSDESLIRHMKDRKIKSYDMDSETASTLYGTSAEERYGLESAISATMMEPVKEEEEEEGEKATTTVEGTNETENNVTAIEEEQTAEEEEVTEAEINAITATIDDIDINQEENNDIAKVTMDDDSEEEVDATQEQEEENEPNEVQGIEEEEDGREKEAKPETTTVNQVTPINEQSEFQLMKPNEKVKKNGAKGSSNKKGGDGKSNKEKGNQTKPPQQTQQPQSSASSTIATQDKNKKKPINKKKARRYVEQDEEDREEAMLRLGHASKNTGEKLEDQIKKIDAVQQKKELQLRQAKAGVHLLKKDWLTVLTTMIDDVEVREEFKEIVLDEKLLNEEEITETEIQALSYLSKDNALQAFTLLRDSKEQVKKAQKKSGFFLGILRRLMKMQESQKIIVSSTNATSHPNNTNNAKVITEKSSVAIGPTEVTSGSSATPTTTIMEDPNDGMDEDELAQVQESLKDIDDIVKLVGNPWPEDQLLYAVPMCGPYLSLQNLKYKVKLTPGTVKKGKAVKTAVELFSRSKECSDIEKTLMKKIGDNELVTVMVGDVKLSMPGLQQQKQQIKKSKKGKK